MDIQLRDMDSKEGRLPRLVDTEARRREVVNAAAKLVSRGGFEILTLSNLAKELGGSMRLVTHYFTDRKDLIVALLDAGLRETQSVLDDLQRIDDDRARMTCALSWLLPDDDESLQLERVRVALMVHREREPEVTAFFSKADEAVRAVLALALPKSSSWPEELFVDILRVWATGVALSTVEHPERWSPNRQREAMHLFVEQMLLQ